ncbi:Helix-turn-helix domain [Mycobacteroides abscessus subsp. massiliense]|uniref:helix-turn-helix domain-containing protein n=1 Tax=Mycobacteroides abscessus TaxID=36809 RepID=UPI0009A5A117|nr:helix-turn-helix domain-containing protein [Mycobacteroides abscessus]SKU62611.1 Helix-turn-helix domain [Mycobacteroides abscessus subsp. massiliense]SKU82300.1 Helix-turn-helix domain [Mycobacteroides abscessus subsp. massiliense]
MTATLQELAAQAGMTADSSPVEMARIATTIADTGLTPLSAHETLRALLRIQRQTQAPEFVTTKVAATILDIHPETLRFWSRRGLYDLPAPTRAGSQLRWDATEIRAWAERRKRRLAAS